MSLRKEGESEKTINRKGRVEMTVPCSVLGCRVVGCGELFIFCPLNCLFFFLTVFFLLNCFFLAASFFSFEL